MTIVRRSSPFGELMTLRSAMDRLFEDSFVPRWTGLNDSNGVALDVSTTADELRVEASLPGFKPEDVEVTIEGGTLTITGQTSSEDQKGEGSYLVKEIRRGTFTRSVTLPDGLEPDKASATFENGILSLRVPKAEKVKPRQIRISPVSEGRVASQVAGQPANGAAAPESTAGA